MPLNKMFHSSCGLEKKIHPQIVPLPFWVAQFLLEPSREGRNPVHAVLTDCSVTWGGLEACRTKVTSRSKPEQLKLRSHKRGQCSDGGLRGNSSLVAPISVNQVAPHQTASGKTCKGPNLCKGVRIVAGTGAARATCFAIWFSRKEKSTNCDLQFLHWTCKQEAYSVPAPETLILSPAPRDSTT